MSRVISNWQVASLGFIPEKVAVLDWNSLFTLSDIVSAMLNASCVNLLGSKKSLDSCNSIVGLNDDW